jgi:hypothetical protein
LAEFSNEALKFYCALHTSLELPDEVFEDSSFDLYEKLKTNVFCPKKEHWKVRVTCLRLQPKCLRKCIPIRQVLGDVPLKLAKEICDKCWEVEKSARAKRKAEEERS